MNSTKDAAPAAPRVMHIFRALRSRNYRLFFAGQGVSLLGTWMQSVAMTWLVYRLTDSVALLGVTGFASQIPAFILSSIAGVLADRFDKRHILILTQSVALLQALALALLTLMDAISVWQVIALSVVLGIVNAFDIPTRQAYVVEMIEDKEDLGNAIALNSTLFNGARLVGPSIAGLLIGAIGEGWCFLLNAASFLAVLASLAAMRTRRRASTAPPAGMMDGWQEGVRYAMTNVPIRAVLMMLAAMSLVGMPYTVLMPVFARDVLHGGAHTLGFLMGCSGVGALAGALTLAQRSSTRGLGRWISIFGAVFGAGLLLFSFSRTEALSMMLLVVVGYGMMLTMASCNTVIQARTDDHMRGRVMSLYTMSFMGTMPFGSLLAGMLATRIGTPETVLVSGIVCIVAASAFALSLPSIRAAARAADTSQMKTPVEPAS